MHELLEHMQKDKEITRVNLESTKGINHDALESNIDTLMDEGYVLSVKGKLKLSDKGKKYSIILNFVGGFRL